MRTDVTSVPEEETSVLYEETSRRTVKNESWGALASASKSAKTSSEFRTVRARRAKLTSGVSDGG